MEEQTLLEQIASIENLNKAWSLLNKENEDSHGLSGITIKNFQENFDQKVEEINKELLAGNFQFSQTRAAFIRKDNGKLRPLQIPEIRDRLVLKSISLVLENEFKEILNKSEGISFAYQRGKGVREAVIQMKIEFDKGNSVILKADIIKFFEKIDKQQLIESDILPNLKDKTINELIRNALNQKLGGLKRINKKAREIFSNSQNGIPQGNPLSPLLSNIYLAEFDEFTKKEGMPMVRYADDFVVLFKSKKEAHDGYNKICTFLNDNYSLEIHPINEEDKNAKTQIIDPKKSQLNFLSVKFDGLKLFPGKDKLGILKSKVAKVIRENRESKELLTELYKTIDKWIAIYSYLDIERYFDTIDAYVITQLNKHVGKGKISPKKCSELTQSRRVKQKNKSSNSFWRRREIKKYLPKIFKSKRKTTTSKIQKRN